MTLSDAGQAMTLSDAGCDADAINESSATAQVSESPASDSPTSTLADNIRDATLTSCPGTRDPVENPQAQTASARRPVRDYARGLAAHTRSCATSVRQFFAPRLASLQPSPGKIRTFFAVLPVLSVFPLIFYLTWLLPASREADTGWRKEARSCQVGRGTRTRKLLYRRYTGGLPFMMPPQGMLCPPTGKLVVIRPRASTLRS